MTVVAALALGSCRGEAPAAPAAPPAHPAAPAVAAAAGVAAPTVVPIALTDFRAASRDAIAEAGLTERQVRVLPGLHRLARLGRAVVRITHVCYEEDAFAPDDCFRREGFLVLLGEHRGRVIGLTTRCAVDVHQPGYQYLDPHEPGAPELVAGILALHPPGAPAGARPDVHLIEHETDWHHPLLQAPYGRFVDEHLAAVGLDAPGWARVLEGGARVVMRPIGRNDLALVAFEPRPQLGVEGTATPAGVAITAVWSDSAAARAGFTVGEVVTRVGDTAVHTPVELAEQCATWPAGTPASIQVRVSVDPGAGTRRRLVTFTRPSDFLADGTCDTLGVAAPMEAVATLLESLQQVGDLLQTELTAQCAQCRERVQRAEVRGAPDLAETLGRLVPLVGGLLSLDADRAVDAAGRVTGVGAFVDAVEEWRRVLQGVDDLEAFLRAFPLGDPMALDPATAEATAADRLTACDLAGVRHTLRLAYCAAVPGGTGELERILAMARTERRLLVAVPDGVDLDGVAHVHLLVVRPDAWPPTTWRARADVASEGYVNGVLIRAGACTAADYGVSDGRSTRLILEALRRLDHLDRAR